MADTNQSQLFIIELKLFTECEEKVNEAFVANWVLQQFEGCDFASVELREVEEVNNC